jgi:hypothetical protein
MLRKRENLPSALTRHGPFNRSYFGQPIYPPPTKETTHLTASPPAPPPLRTL